MRAVSWDGPRRPIRAWRSPYVVDARELYDQAQSIADDPERQQDYRRNCVHRRAQHAVRLVRLGGGRGGYRIGDRTLGAPGRRIALVGGYRPAVGPAHAGYRGGSLAA